MTNVQVISSKTIVKAKYVEFKELRVLVGGKNKDKYYNLHRTPVSMVFPITDNYEVYLVSEYRLLYEKRVLGAVAGFIDTGETSLQAAKRELSEEAGITANHWEEILRTELAGSIVKATIHIFLATGLEIGQHNREISEDIELVRMPLDEAVQRVLDGQINNASAVAGLLLLDKLKKEKKI